MPTLPETVRWILDPRSPRREVGPLLQNLSDTEKDEVIQRLAETARRVEIKLTGRLE